MWVSVNNIKFVDQIGSVAMGKYFVRMWVQMATRTLSYASISLIILDETWLYRSNARRRRMNWYFAEIQKLEIVMTKFEANDVIHSVMHVHGF